MWAYSSKTTADIVRDGDVSRVDLGLVANVLSCLREFHLAHEVLEAGMSAKAVEGGFDLEKDH
jgi:hypothetical protein